MGDTHALIHCRNHCIIATGDNDKIELQKLCDQRLEILARGEGPKNTDGNNSGIRNYRTGSSNASQYLQDVGNKGKERCNQQ